MKNTLYAVVKQAFVDGQSPADAVVTAHATFTERTRSSVRSVVYSLYYRFRKSAPAKPARKPDDIDRLLMQAQVLLASLPCNVRRKMSELAQAACYHENAATRRAAAHSLQRLQDQHLFT